MSCVLTIQQVLPAVDRHQRRIVLCASDLWLARSLIQHNLPSCHRCCRHRHVLRHHPSHSVHRQAGPQACAGPGSDCNGHLPHHHRRHLCQEREPVADTQSSRMGRDCNGVVVRCPLRLVLGTLVSVCLIRALACTNPLPAPGSSLQKSGRCRRGRTGLRLARRLIG
jgi:hypothetical protein